ncbi:MAG: DNA repair protein RadC [Bacteroidales bacterium]|nr:DNA repair protein RadC [Bacteroidales bacterium]
MKLKEMCASERPREKMMHSGVDSLSNGELLAILLRSGTKECSVLELSQKILSDCDGKLCTLSNKSFSQLCSISGISVSKACTIMASLELGRRFMNESQVYGYQHPITSARTVYELMLPTFKGIKHEEIWALLLNRANKLIRRQLIGTGSDSEAILDTKQIIRSCLDCHASSIILIHNHPSGNPFPSAADITQTSALRKALKLCDINLVDHVIICDDCFYSFSEEVVRKS